MYQAVLFAENGDRVTDCHNKETKQEVWDEIADLGSKWIFFPIPFVATQKTIVDVPDGLEHLKGKRITTVMKHIKQVWIENPNRVCDVLNSGDPLWLIY